MILPIVLLMKESVRTHPWKLFSVSCLTAFGLLLNRFNCFLLAFEPRPGYHYFPSLGEVAISAMMVAFVFVAYKVHVNYLPVLPSESRFSKSQS